MMLRHPSTLANVRVLRPASWKRYLVAASLVALYSVSIKYYTETVGQPYEWALEEQKRSLREKANAAREQGVSFQSGKQDRKETELEIDYESLPSAFLPGAWTCALIFFTISCHALFHLLCVWSIGFKANVLYQPSKNVFDGCFIWCTPHKHKGKADICLVEESEVTFKYTFTFQYQSYEYIEPEEADKDDAIEGEKGSDLGAVRLIQCPVNLTWGQYKNSRGLKTDGEIEKATDKYGPNIFDLPKPTFLQLYKKQLLSPIAVFQFFCTGLWMLDTYWKYTCFTLMSILGFEASTAFQRLKSMATLRGMSTKSYNLWVYRKGSWQERPIEELLPGDLISVSSAKDASEAAPTGSEGGSKPAEQNQMTLPCDCVLLRGSAIVNEASLTGESVPQMKDALSAGSDHTMQMDVFGKHRIHALFSGTSLIQATPAPHSLKDDDDTVDAGGAVVAPPNNGIVCYVLRTGFNSSQGELMRMIEFSTDDVSADTIETCCQLLFLLMFALVAAGYVLKKGMEDESRSQFKTLLRCTLIITNVVPPSLPMQMAFAVHTALMALLKSGIYCTEPFRVPFAGKVSHCFFDKTGTLTSDQMVAVGIVNADNGKKGAKGEQLQMKEVSTVAAAIVAGCHSLIEVDGKAIGDPIEVAALKGVGWSYVPQTNTASPGRWRAKEQLIAKQRQYLGTLRADMEADKKEKEELVKKLEDLEKTFKQDQQDAKKLQIGIEQRFHFSSDLQRMSTICRVACHGSGGMPSGAYCFTKGSPEAIGRLLASQPDWYEATYQRLAEQGQRVLALGYRHLGNDSGIAREMAQKSRDSSEQNLTFAGFISFKCETRKDSPLVIRSLRDSNHRCVMLTGDAPLTALSVAQEVGISSFSASKSLILSPGDDGLLQWTPAISSDGEKRGPVPFKPAEMEALSREHDLIITGASLELALSGKEAEAVNANLGAVLVFARLSPWQKEQVIHATKATIGKDSTMMCGDGGNDVGALKEADVGLALLSGFGNANAGGPDAEKKKKEQDGVVAKVAAQKTAEDELAEQRAEAMQRAQQMGKKAQQDLARRRKDLVAKQQQWVEEELQARRQRGEDTGFMGQMGAMKSVMNRVRTEMKTEQEAVQRKNGSAFAAGAAKWAEGMDEMEDTPMVRLGDASTAAPFTTRMPSIASCVDIVRQGRCTLLSAVQQMEIMMLESMISAYTMSTMSVDGTRPSEPQMMASGVLMSVASLAFSFARPIDRMHPVRPLQSVFHPAILFSMLGQLAIHLGCMVYMAQLAKELMGEEAVKEIMEFEKEREKMISEMPEETFNDFAWFTSVPFKPNLLNTCCWLVETSQQVSVIFVNYKGRPWMKGLLENQPLFISLVLCIAMVAVCAWGLVPYLNHILNLEVLPEDLRPTVMFVLFTSLIGSFCWDRLMVFIFARHIHDAQLDELRSVTLADFVPLLKTVGYTCGGLLMLLTGNPLIMGVCFMLYRNFKSNEQQETGGGRPA